jgi:hypothetical protein
VSVKCVCDAGVFLDVETISGLGNVMEARYFDVADSMNAKDGLDPQCVAAEVRRRCVVGVIMAVMVFVVVVVVVASSPPSSSPPPPSRAVVGCDACSRVRRTRVTW